MWGKERVSRAVELSRDMYLYIRMHQTLRLANRGLSMQEIAEELRLPPELEQPFALRGSVGTLSHNIKGVYTYYLGWFDGNAARLNPLPPSRAAEKYVEYMGGAREVLKRARADYAGRSAGWRRYLIIPVSADPSDREARELSGG